MADQAQNVTEAQIPKGKGKAPDVTDDVSMGEDEDDDDEEEDEEEDDEFDPEPEEELGGEGPDAIDLDNIVSTGRRTRGKVIDFKKAAESSDLPPEEEEEEDDDYEAPDEEMEG